MTNLFPQDLLLPKAGLHRVRFDPDRDFWAFPISCSIEFTFTVTRRDYSFSFKGLAL